MEELDRKILGGNLMVVGLILMVFGTCSMISTTMWTGWYEDNGLDLTISSGLITIDVLMMISGFISAVWGAALFISEPRHHYQQPYQRVGKWQQYQPPQQQQQPPPQPYYRDEQQPPQQQPPQQPY